MMKSVGWSSTKSYRYHQVQRFYLGFLGLYWDQSKTLVWRYGQQMIHLSLYLITRSFLQREDLVYPLFLVNGRMS